MKNLKNTIKMFSEININQNLNQSDINSILKRLYETNFFENIEVEFQNSNLKIIVKNDYRKNSFFRHKSRKN